jgi:hypothetical protein
VAPSSSRNEIADVTDDAVRIKVTAPPVEGKANRALAAFLGKTFKIPKSRVKIVKGEAGRQKKVLLAGLEKEEVIKILMEKWKKRDKNS